MQWYVAEQVEEEDNTSTLMRKLKNIGDHMPSLMQVDAQLAVRAFRPPVIPGTTVGGP
jgi:ferritin